jgi:hypothetical protein
VGRPLKLVLYMVEIAMEESYFHHNIIYPSDMQKGDPYLHTHSLLVSTSNPLDSKQKLFDGRRADPLIPHLR